MSFILEVEQNDFPRLKASILAEVRDVVARSAENIAEGAIDRAPVDTGYLASTIHTEATADGELVEVVVDADYAQYVEYGTSTHRAQPFLTPAVEAEQDSFIRELERAMMVSGTSYTIRRE